MKLIKGIADLNVENLYDKPGYLQHSQSVNFPENA